MADTVPAYKILALGPFATVPDGKSKPNFVKLDLYSIDEAVKAISPVLYLSMPTDLCSDGALTLKFSRIKDFKPDSIIKNNSFFQTLSKGKKVTPKKVQESDAVDNILSMVDVSNFSSDESIKGSDTDKIMQEIFSNNEFQKTESAWRGISCLIKQAEIKGFNKISVSISAVSHNSLERVLSAVESLPCDEVPNLILIDLGFDNTMPSIELLEKVIQFADKMMIPVCIDLKPEFFRIDDFNQLDKLQYINHYLEDVSYAKFRKLKEPAGASWLIANCNRFAVRDANEFERQPLSASSVWATGTLCAKAVNETGWPMDFSRYTTYSIDDLPMFNQDEKYSTSIQALFSDERIIQLAEAGITPVVGAKNKDFVFIPKETSLAGESIKFQMFFNRILESIINIREQKDSDLTPEEGVEKALTDIFMQTGHDKPENISVVKEDNDMQDQEVFLISFIPPASVIVGSNMVEFTFIW